MPSTRGRPVIGDGVESPTTHIRIAAGLCGVFGIVWLFLSMLLVGFVALRSGAARDIDPDSGLALFCFGVGIATWAGGIVLIGLYLVAIVKQRYWPATLAFLTPLLAGTVLYLGPTSDGDWLGSVPTPGVAVLAATLVMTATALVVRMIRASRKGDDAAKGRNGSIRSVPAIAAMVVGAVGLALTAWVLYMSFVGSDAWSRDTPWGVAAWVFVLGGVWTVSYWLWRRAARNHYPLGHAATGDESLGTRELPTIR